MLYKNIELEEYIGNQSIKFIDLTGKTFGKLYVICRAPIQGVNLSLFWAECECGNIQTYHSSHLKRGNTTMCKHCSKNQFLLSKFNGVGEISFAYWNELKRGAAGEKSSRTSRKIKKFEITINEAWELFLKQNKKCALTGLDIKFVKIGRSNKQRLKEQTASLDRIDSSKDYTIDNVQWVHKDINRMKNIYDQEYFINMCTLVTENNSKKY